MCKVPHELTERAVVGVLWLVTDKAHRISSRFTNIGQFPNRLTHIHIFYIDEAAAYTPSTSGSLEPIVDSLKIHGQINRFPYFHIF